jgi:hypothetical protein
MGDSPRLSRLAYFAMMPTIIPPITFGPACNETGNIMRDYVLIESDPYGQEMLRRELQSIENETTAAVVGH